MVQYRLKFSFDSFDKVEQREDTINSLLSDLTDIVSDSPIRKPEVNEVVIVNDIRYKVKEVTISFEVVSRTTYYDFNVSLSKEVVIKKTPAKVKYFDASSMEVLKRRAMDNAMKKTFK